MAGARAAVSRVVVIGGGVGGLAAAARLAGAGHEVVICEQAGTVGGKLGLLTRDGFRFDTGPSLLTWPAVLAEVFAATGAPLHETLTLERVEPITRVRFADGATVETSSDLGRTAASLDAALRPGSGTEWLALLGRAERMWQAVERPVLRSPLDGPLALARLTTRVRDLAAIAPHRTLRDLGRALLTDPRLRMLLDRYATYAGSDPRRAPAALATIPYLEQRFGGWYVRGGLYRIAEALRDRACERGARLRLHARVAAIETASGRVSGVRLADGERLAAEVVVANADARMVFDRLLADEAAGARRARRRLRAVAPSLSGLALLLGVRGRTPDLAHHTVLFAADYDAEFDALLGPQPRPVADPTLYVAVPPDPAVAPPGHEAWFVLVNAPRCDQWPWSADTAEREADRLLDLLAARGLDVRGRVLFREVRTPADLERHTGAVGGAIYGSSSNGVRAAFLRPGNRGPLPGLFLVGGSAHPGGGLPLVLLSAAIAAELIGPA